MGTEANRRVLNDPKFHFKVWRSVGLVMTCVYIFMYVSENREREKIGWVVTLHTLKTHNHDKQTGRGGITMLI